jgi:iron only hydrogenase large subunit-like protein
MCGAKHLGDNVACVKKCIEGGMTPVFVDEAKKAVWKIDNPDAVKDFYGDHVAITATLNKAAMSVHVNTISAAK